MENTMYEMTQDGQTFEVGKSLYLFIEFMKEMGHDVSNIDEVINQMQPFLTCWEDYKQSLDDAKFENPSIKKFALFHQIKPNSKYAHQQKKGILYAISRISQDTVHSTAVGGNYPVKDCNFFVKNGDKFVLLK
jgi:hypothetical protein